MKILFLTDNYPPERNAAASRVSERIVYWTAAGHQVTVITSHPNFPDGRLFQGYKNEWRKIEVVDGVRLVRVKTFISPNSGFALRLFDFLSFMFTSFFAGIREDRPDIVVSNSPQFFCAVSGWAVAVVKRRPFIFEIADLWPASITAVGAMRKSFALSAVERLELFLYRQARRVVALTNSFKTDLISRGINADKIDVVTNGVNMSLYSRRPKDVELLKELGLEGKFVIGYIGTHGLAHALENVIYAADRLRENPKVRFLFVGPGAARQKLIDLTKLYSVPNVIFVDSKPKSEIARYWSICDLALVHLKNETTFEGVIPSKIFEAMGMGLPVLMASPFGEGPEILAATKSGFWVEAEDPDALAEKVLELSESPEVVRAAAERSFEAAPKYSRRAQAEKFILALERALDASPT